MDQLPDFVTMPKVELHVHPEGAISLETMWALVKTKGEAGSMSSVDDLRQRFDFRDFGHFVDVWVWNNRFLDSHEAFTVAA